MRYRYLFSFLIPAAALAPGCAHQPRTIPPPTAQFACERAEHEAFQNAVDAAWGRSDASRLSTASPAGAAGERRSGTTFQAVSTARSAWASGYVVQGRYWTEQCRLALQRERVP